MFADDLLPATMRPAGAHPDAGVALDIRLNWYRSLPLSCVEAVGLTIDGTAVPTERLQLRTNGFQAPVGALGDAADVWWRVIDPAELVAQRDDLAPGPHEVELVLTLRIPYYGPLPNGGFVTITDRATGTVVR
jgi:Domain of unknown function (DUF6379)